MATLAPEDYYQVSANETDVPFLKESLDNSDFWRLFLDF